MLLLMLDPGCLRVAGFPNTCSGNLQRVANRNVGVNGVNYISFRFGNRLRSYFLGVSVKLTVYGADDENEARIVKCRGARARVGHRLDRM